MSNEKKSVKDKIDGVLDKQPKEEPKVVDKDKPTVFSLFGKKIFGDIELYLSKLNGQSVSRAAATKFRGEIEEKIEDGKEKDALIKYFNKKFKWEGVSTLPWNFFVETVIDINASKKDEEKLLKGIEKVLVDNYDELTNREEAEKDFSDIAKEIMSFIKDFNKPKELTVNERKV